MSILWVLYFHLELTAYQSNIIINREVFVIFVAMTSILGLFSIFSTLLIENVNCCLKRSRCWSISLICLSIVFILALIAALAGQIGLCFNTDLGPYQFTVHNETTLIKAQRLGKSPDFNHYRGFTSCRDDYDFYDVEFLGCLINGTKSKVHVYVDRRPSSPLPNSVITKDFILIKENSEDERVLRDIKVTSEFFLCNDFSPRSEFVQGVSRTKALNLKSMVSTLVKLQSGAKMSSLSPLIFEYVDESADLSVDTA